MTSHSEWWQTVFDDFRPIFGLLSKRATNEQVRYLIKKLDLKPGKLFLDCPCGIGRIALPLARKGIKVTGVDITDSYLEELRLKVARGRLPITICKCDMRRIRYENQFDAAGNLWTSFGFFKKRSDDRLTLRKLYHALKPGGKAVLHVINRDWILTNYSHSGWQRIGGTTILEQRQFDYATSVSRDTCQFIDEGRIRTHEVELRMYSYHELIDMFTSVGFVDIEGFGSTKDEAIDSRKQMQFVFGTKPPRKR